MQNELNVKVPFLSKNFMFYIYSAFFGMVCGLNFYCLLRIAFIDKRLYPNSYPVYALIGIFAFFACLLFFGLYCSYYRYMKKKLQTIFHLITALAGFIFGFPFSKLMDNLILYILDASVF